MRSLRVKEAIQHDTVGFRNASSLLAVRVTVYFFPYDTPMPARTSLWIPYGAIG
jgi:hypothetical protein